MADETVPQPSTARPPRRAYKLHWITITLSSIIAMVALPLAYATTKGDPSIRIAVAVVFVIIWASLSWLFGCAAYLVTRRSNVVGSIVCLLILCLLPLSSAAQLLISVAKRSRTSAPEAVTTHKEMMRIKKEKSEAIRSGDIDKLSKLTAESVDALNRGAAAAKGEDSLVYAALAAWMTKTKAISDEYYGAINAMNSEEDLTPNSKVNREQIQNRIKHLRSVRESYNKMTAHLDQIDEIRTSMINSGVSRERAYREMAAFRSGARSEINDRARALDGVAVDSLYVASEITLEYADNIWIDEHGDFVFDDSVPPEKVQAYQDAMDRMVQAAQEQEELNKKR